MRQGAVVFTGGIALLIAVATLWPLPEGAWRASQTNVFCLVCGESGAQDILQNIALFLPFGFGLALLGIGAVRGTLVGFAFVFTIELLQYAVVPGRDASLSDVLTNTLGTAAGIGLARFRWVLAMPAPREARRLAAGMLLAWALLWGAGAWLLGAGHTETRPWLVAFPRAVEGMSAFTGGTNAGWVDGLPLGRPDYDSLPGFVPDMFARDSFRVRTVVTLDQPVREAQVVLSIWDRDARGIVTMVRRRGHARLGFYARANALRLRGLVFDLGPWFAAPAGTVVDLEVARVGPYLAITGTSVGRHVQAVVGLTPAYLWAMLMPRIIRPGLWWTLESMLWVAAMLAIAGYWWGRGWSGGLLVLPSAVLAVVLIAVPHLFPVAPSPGVAWVLAFAGLLAGIAAGVSSLRFMTPHS